MSYSWVMSIRILIYLSKMTALLCVEATGMHIDILRFDLQLFASALLSPLTGLSEECCTPTSAP